MAKNQSEPKILQLPASVVVLAGFGDSERFFPYNRNRDYMKITDLVFIGIKGSVVALNRATGAPVWVRRLKGSDFVNVVLDGETILASCYGEIFCLDALTGAALWHNPLKGFGLGLTTIATPLNPVGGNPNAVVAKRRRDQQSEDSSGAVPATM